jgi:hypothetical protein
MVIEFSQAAARTSRSPRVAVGSAPATVVILPVIRIERYTVAPAGYAPGESSSPQRRRRRRRSASRG